MTELQPDFHPLPACSHFQRFREFGREKGFFAGSLPSNLPMSPVVLTCRASSLEIPATPSTSPHPRRPAVNWAEISSIWGLNSKVGGGAHFG